MALPAMKVKPMPLARQGASPGDRWSRSGGPGASGRTRPAITHQRARLTARKPANTLPRGAVRRVMRLTMKG